ncbi:MAG: hypothetical protein LH679_21580 [Cyanobacteria bacterium CAN_BIN43]|nr:hypothetical protein [Cyanobacteria bacterium CAN_BIN43]
MLKGKCSSFRSRFVTVEVGQLVEVTGFESKRSTIKENTANHNFSKRQTM